MHIKETTHTTQDHTILEGREYVAESEHYMLLLFLGLGGRATSKSVEHFAKELEKKHITLVVYSARGHGNSQGEFYLQKHISDIKELEKKYKLIADQRNLRLVLAGHSISGRSLLLSGISTDVILLNPTLFRGHPKYVSLPFIRRLYLLWWNYFVFKKFSWTHFGSIKFTKHLFKDLITQMSSQDFPTQRIQSRCLLLITSKDVVAKYDIISIRDKVKQLLRKRYNNFFYHLIPGLDHEFSDDYRTFMRSEKTPFIAKEIEVFMRSE